MKRIASGLLAILTFALVFPAGAFAQNAIAVQNASGDPGDNDVIVRIELDNDTDVGGFQFILTDVTGDLTPQSVRAGTRLDGLFTLFDVIVIDGNTGIDSVRVLGIDIDSLKVLPALKGVIVEVLYNVANGATGPYNLTLSGVVLSDPTASEISPVTTTPPGVFSIVATPPTALNFENSETTVSVGENGTVTINMDNSQLTGTRGVAAIQFTLDDAAHSDVVDYIDGSITTVGRAASAGFSVDANANETSEDLIIVIRNLSGGIIPPGTGAIATLGFKGVSSGKVLIVFSKVILADGDPVALPQGTHIGTLLKVNIPPTLDFILDPAAIDEDAAEQKVNLSGITAGGAETQDLTVTASSSNTALIPDPLVTYTSANATGTLSYTPVANANGTVTITVVVTDAGLDGLFGNGDDGSVKKTFTVTVNAVNDSPTITNPITVMVAEENQAFSFAVDPVGKVGGTFIDPEGDDVVFSQEGKPSWLNFNTVTGVFSGTPEEGTAGTHTISVTVTETTTDPPLSSSKDFTLTVNQDATAPSFTRFPIVQEISENSAVFLWVANEEVKGKAETVILNQQIGERRVLSIQDNPAETTEFKKKDRVTVDGLTADSLYHATVTITDRRGNFVVSKPLLFKTLGTADTAPPIFKVLPVLVNRTENSLTYKWKANEASKATLTITQKKGPEDEFFADLDTVLTFSTADFSETGEISATGLDADTRYKGQFSLEDAKGNAPPTTGSLTNNPADVEDRTRPTADITSPVATTEPVAEVSNTTANILYSTNEDATTVIEYGESAALGLTFTIADFVRDHNVRLTGLKADTKYFFRLGAAVDRSGNAMTPTALQSFKTKQSPDTAGPLFTRGPSVISITNVAAVLRWTNNELASFALEVTEKDTTNTIRAASGDLELTRTITVHDLTLDTQYDYSLTATDAAGNSSAVRTGTFRTKKAVDTRPPRITGALTFTTTYARATGAAPDTRIRAVWVTDEASDSRGKIYFGPGIGDLVDVVNDPNLTTDHALTFTGLTSDTTYTIKISSFDANGNEAKSEGAKRTRLAPDVTPPTPTGITATADVGRALIKWVTSEPANSRVFFSTTRSDLDGDASAAQAVTLAGLVTRHAVALTELGTSAQKYFYKVQSRDAAENRSFPLPDFARSFTTLTAEPKLSVTGGTLSGDAASTTTAIVLWNTNVPSTSRVLFGIRPTDNSPVDLDNSVEDDNLVTIHTATLTGLDAGTTYQFKVSSTNASGSQTAVAPGAGKAFPKFTTKEIVDALKPLLTARPSREYKADKKVILKWKTDEKATSSVYYREAGQVNFQRQDAIPLTANITNHLISIEELNPGTSYDFVIESADGEGNTLRFPAGAVVTRLASGLFKITGISQVGLGSFVTNDGPDTQAPVILSGPIVTGTNTDAVTLNWTTDELSTSTVNFGEGNTTDQQVENGTLVTTHTVTLTGLSASTVYSYAVSSIDPSNNGPTTSAAAVVQTSAQADVTPPDISNISTSSTFVSSADGASATITWDTDESSDTQVEFGTTVALGQTKTQSESVTGHSVTITRLTPSTLYSYRVASTDVSGNGPSVSSTATFTTANAADTSPPTFSNIKTDGTTDTKVEVSWDTNENASSILLVINAAGDTSRVESGTQTSTHTLSVTDAAFISASTAYTVVVQGEDNSGNLGTSSGTAVSTSAGPDVTAPSTPTGLTAAAGNAEVKLDWTAVSATDLAGYNVFKNSSQVASNVTENTYTATGLTNGTLVTFEVRAIDQTGNESTANPTATATPALTLAPSAPPNLGTFEGGVEVSTVSLKPILVVGNVTPVDGRATPIYTFTVYTDAGLTNLVTSISGITEGTSGNPTHWQVSDPTLADGIVLLDATTYHWRSRANDGVTDGPWSATKTFTTSASKPTAVQLTGFIAESHRGIVDIRWQTFSNLGLKGFHVYRSLNPGGPFELISGDALIAATEAEYVFQDRDVTINVTYHYQVEAINHDEASQRFGPITVKVSPPNNFTLDQNFPNPFNPSTSIRYELPVAGQVHLVVYNLLGQQVTTLIEGRQQAGFHTVTWNGLDSSHRSVATGVYFYRIVVNGDDKNTFTSSKKMLLLK